MVNDIDAGSEAVNDDPQMPKIEFPCLYPIKIIGVASASFQQEVIQAIERYTGKITDDLIKVRPSKQRNYVALTITIAAAGESQLKSIFSDLKAISNVKMVL